MQLVGPDLAFRLIDAAMSQSDMDDFLERLNAISEAVDEVNKRGKE